MVQHQQQQTAPVRNVMGNMTMTSGSRRPRVRSPSLEPTCHPIGAFSNNNPFSTRHDFSDDDKQEMNLPVLLLESPLHIPDPRAAPIVWILREKFLKLDTLHIVTPRLALLARNDNRRYNTWYLDSCRGQHMVGSERYISNAVSTPTVTYVTVANNTRLRASAQGIVVLKARGSRTHITLNDVLIVHNLCFNLLSVAQLMDCGADLSTDPETRDIMLHYTTPNKARKQIGRAHSNNGVYILDFDIPNCSGDSQELFDLVTSARDVIFYELIFLWQFREDEQANANCVYANDRHSYTSLEDEAAAAIMEQDTRGKFTRGDRRSDDDDDHDDSPGGGAGAAGRSGSGRGTPPRAPPEQESGDDDVQEVILQHRHNSTISGLQLLGLQTATSTAPRAIESKNLRQALMGPHSKEFRETMDEEIKALESRDTWVLVGRAAIKERRILSRKWVFRVKTAADGIIKQFKSRWVMREYDQRHGIDFDQTFALVSRHTSVRILLAIATTGHLLL
ncbi:unnamed protein product [Closterium sp. NIES-54]